MDKNNINAWLQVGKKRAEERGVQEQIADFEEIYLCEPAAIKEKQFDDAKMSDSSQYINYNWEIVSDVPIRSANSLSAILKRIVKKMVLPIITPIIEQQNAYNMQNARCIVETKLFIDEMEEYKKRIIELEAEIENLKQNKE